MDIILYLAFFVFGFYTAAFVFTYQIKKIIKNLAKVHNIDLQSLNETPNTQTITIMNIETVNNTYFLYDDKNNFLCQGITLEDAAENLFKYKNIKFAIGILENKSYYFSEGKVQKS